MNFTILTGMSGSGKTQATNILEDMGFYVVDNMPVALISKFIELYTNTAFKNTKVVFTVDVRGEEDFEPILNLVSGLREMGHECNVLFIDCSDAILLNRYKESRRLHPLMASKNIPIEEAFELERKLLLPIRESADYLVDTTGTTIAQLREKISSIMADRGDKSNIFVTCMSFGFKHGIAVEADLVFDVRCFPNPYYIPELKKLTGIDKAVSDYVFSFESTKSFLEKLFDMIDFLMPLYIEESKKQINIAIGCTGGKHRSVAICEALSKHLADNGMKVLTVHRDISK